MSISPNDALNFHNVSPSRVINARTSTACQICRDKKVKCSGSQPCQYCTRRLLTCIFPENPKKRLYPESEVEELRKKLTSYEQRIRSMEAIVSQRSPEKSIDSSSSVRNCTFQTPLTEDQGPKEHSILPDITLSSSRKFGQEVYSNTSIQGSGTPAVLTPEDTYGLSRRRLDKISISRTESWPDEEEAHALLEFVLIFVGQSQQLFDPRAFSDGLAIFYQNSHSETQLNKVWVVEMLLIFAIGKLFKNNGDLEAEELPGVDYYLEAMRRMPDLHALRSEGSLGVEIMGLVALYLQYSDCKDDGYVYACTGLRLAISQGMHRASSTNQYLRSEKVHRNRLWWTIYMQERRLAAATGHPLSISDSVIDIELPSNAPGFASPISLIINVKIARITGEIMTTVYGTEKSPRRAFIETVQEILSALHDIGLTMPPEVELNFSRTPLQASRTSGSLHLMLFQAIILTLRPILLHLAPAKQKQRNNIADAEPTLHKLAGTCIMAARRSLDVLQSLLDQNMLARFGFFDQDAAFSVAFVFILAYNINPNDILSLKGAEQACQVLQHLVSNGNEAARKCLAEIYQMCSHLKIPLRDNVHQTPIPNDYTRPESTSESPNAGGPENQTIIGQARFTPGGDRDIISSIDVENPVTFPSHGSDSVEDQWVLGFSGIPLQEQNDSIYSIYHDSSFTLTGVDFADWVEFDRHIV